MMYEKRMKGNSIRKRQICIIRKSKFSKNPKRSVHKIEGLEKRSVQKSSYAHGQESTEEICFFGAFLLLYILVILQ